jgi:hypothetical protein
MSHSSINQPSRRPVDVINKVQHDLYYECQRLGLSIYQVQRISWLVGNGLFDVYNLGLFTPLRPAVVPE